jgi:hypothetical protein
VAQGRLYFVRLVEKGKVFEEIMIANSNGRQTKGPRWRYLLLAALVSVLCVVVLVGLWQAPRLVSQLLGATATPRPPATATSTTLAPTVSATGTVTAFPPTLTPTPTPSVSSPTIGELAATADDQTGALTLRMAAEVPPDRQIEEVLLWYDTEIGHQVWRFAGPLPASVTLSHEIDAAREGLTTTLTTGELDYWWLVRDTAGESDRAGGTVSMGPGLRAQVTTPTPKPPPLDFQWVVSETKHFQFHLMADTAAERDLHHIGPLAEAALARTSDVLEVGFDDQMSVYLVPRIFWQGAAVYANKVQLISYLDRNYTAIETWSYFTHEGTHALAQDLIQPKDEGGPDGVLVEGLAVWASDGHYRQEPLDVWAAVVAASDQYIPLADLRAGPFYDFQHEISYLEAASFVKFLVERYGLDTVKEHYGLATGDEDHDEALAQRLYGQSYADLETAWLGYLASLEPTEEQAETWRLTVRSFDLMRRYETEMDPDARVLPSEPPPEWTTDTLKIFLNRAREPANVVLETALIAAQENLYDGDPAAAAALLDDVEAALDAGGVADRPSLQARQAIVEMVAAQDRAILRADTDAYLATVDPASALALESVVEERLQPPLITYRQEVVRLEMADDGRRAWGEVLVHGEVFDGGLNNNGQLFSVVFGQTRGRWLMSYREPLEPRLLMPPALDQGSGPFLRYPYFVSRIPWTGMQHVGALGGWRLSHE